MSALDRSNNVRPYWRPISTAPMDQLVLVRGPSGYRTHPKFYIGAYQGPARHGTRWYEPGGTDLLEQGWRPEEWMELPK